MLQGRTISALLLSVSLLTVVGSVAYSGHLARELAVEEQKRMEIWAEATHQFIIADENTDIDFVSSIIEGNTTIPVYLTDSAGNILLSRNVTHAVKDPRTLNGPIRIEVTPDNIQYLWYDDSKLLRRLHYFPYVQLALIAVFFLLAVLTLVLGERSERNRVWVGLSKETAHQLGTPISSLNGWLALLREEQPDNIMLPDMERDVERLHVIADRFSKIGSEPELVRTDLGAMVEDTVSYMRTRLPKKVQIDFDVPVKSSETTPYAPKPYEVALSVPLFSWVLENVLKNAVDAGANTIRLTLSEDEQHYLLDIADNGKGIETRRKGRVFTPGYTTKKRGWGLGLSLAKRIVEEYHRGKIFVKSSEPGVGTTFRILLKKAE